MVTIKVDDLKAVGALVAAVVLVLGVDPLVGWWMLYHWVSFGQVYATWLSLVALASTAWLLVYLHHDDEKVKKP